MCEQSRDKGRMEVNTREESFQNNRDKVVKRKDECIGKKE